MKKWILFLILFLGSVCQAANDFSADANCVFLGNMENGALTTDSSGNGNTLTTYNTPDANTVTYKQGSASCNFDSGDALYRTDTNLSANFPGKAGTSNTTFSVCAWIYVDSDLGTFECIASKYRSSVGQRSWAIHADIGNDIFELVIGYNGGASAEVIQLTSCGFGTRAWFHCLATYNGGTKAWVLRVVRDSDSNIVTDSGTATNTMSPDSANLDIGLTADAGNPFAGNIDELVIFDDIVSSAEQDQIIAGTYGAAAGASSAQVIIISKWFDWKEPCIF